MKCVTAGWCLDRRYFLAPFTSSHRASLTPGLFSNCQYVGDEYNDVFVSYNDLRAMDCFGNRGCALHFMSDKRFPCRHEGLLPER
jgi:hypothetical protein